MANIVTYILFLSCLCTGNSQYDDRPPPRYNSHKLPQTRFTCEGKFTGRYYADPDTDCQMFHICHRTSRRDVSDFKFLCPNGTVFDQEHQVCADYYQVVCHFDSDTNPLGSVFEIFKLSAKESTNRREFGSVPSRDPEYLGQNSLGNEDFQVEEYNNNKLASSRNSLHFQSSQIKGKDDTYFSSTYTPQPILFTKEVIITTPTQSTRTTPPPPIITSRKVLGNAPIVPKLSTQQPPHQFTKSSTHPNFSRRIVKVISSPQGFSDPTRVPETITERVTTTSTAPTIHNHRVDEAKEKAPNTKPGSIFDDLRFSDFASLSKFQTQFHRSFSNSPIPTTESPTTTERIITTTFNPTTDKLNKFAFSQQFQSTVSSMPFRNFENSNSFNQQTEEPHIGFTTELPSTAHVDFNTRPRSETKPPHEFRTTRRLPIYQNTFRTTYQDLTTPGPQTFRQQPTRFNEDFFKKIDVQKSDFLKSDDEDDYYANVVFAPSTTEISLTNRDPTEDTGVTFQEFTSTLATTTTTPRPFRRRRPSKQPGLRNGLADHRFKYSRRFQNARFENKSAIVRADQSRSDEIFNVEASINSGSAGINRLQPNKFPVGVTSTTPSGSSTAAHNPRRREFHGRRARPGNDERSHDGQDVEKAFRKLRGGGGQKRFRERLRVSSSTTEENDNFVSATTYRPANKVRPLITTNGISSTTLEPELVTASTDEIERLRSRPKLKSLNSTANTDENLRSPNLLSFRVTSKSSFKALPPSASEAPKNSDESGTEPGRLSFGDTGVTERVEDSIDSLGAGSDGGFGQKFDHV